MGAPSRILFAVCSVWLLCGLSVPKVQLRQSEAASVPLYRFIDARDPKLARSANESLVITNCAYGAVRIGQRDIEPDLSALLHDMLLARFGERIAGREVKLTAFALHINNAAMHRRTVRQMYPGLISALMNNPDKVGCSGDDTRGGYLLGEVPEGVSPFVVAVHVQIDGKPYRGRSISMSIAASPAAKHTLVSENGAPSSRDQLFQRGVDSALSNLGDEIEKGLFPVADPKPGDAEASRVTEASEPTATPEPPVTSEPPSAEPLPEP